MPENGAEKEAKNGWPAAHRRAETLDRSDPLASVRQAFYLPPGKIYLDGNSLGPIPVAAFEEIETAVRQEWAEQLIESWNSADWFQLPVQYGDLLAPIVGADAGEVVVCDTTSLNIFKAVSAALSLRPGRNVIVAEGAGFPTDLYMLEGVAGSRQGVSVRLEGVDGDNLLDLIDDQVAVVLCNQVDYRSGAIRDMASVTAAAHAKGALTVWDLCHSAGVLPIGLNACNADLAVGCTYKYLNGGPGAPAFLFAARRHLPDLRQPLSGWWGHKAPFKFDAKYQADDGIRKFLCGTQPILSFRAFKAGLDLYQSVDMKQLRNKSRQLTDLFIELVEQHCTKFGLELASPRASENRGSQVSFRFADGYPVIQALIARGIVADFRSPDIMRFGFSPLYIRYQDVSAAAEALYDILAAEQWRDPQYQQRAAVT